MAIVGLENRRTAGQTFPEQGTDEQAISEAALNKIVGTAETYDLEVRTRPLFDCHSALSECLYMNNVMILNNLWNTGSRAPKHSYLRSKTIPEGSSVLDVSIGEGY